MKSRQIFDDVIACDLWFRPPQSKVLATPLNRRLSGKLFWRPFFLENTCDCVLGPWPWPRAFLSLASRGSVLGKAVLGLGLGLGFFLCPWPWPWPRALCPRLHLCYRATVLARPQAYSKSQKLSNFLSFFTMTFTISNYVMTKLYLLSRDRTTVNVKRLSSDLDLTVTSFS